MSSKKEYNREEKDNNLEENDDVKITDSDKNAKKSKKVKKIILIIVISIILLLVISFIIMCIFISPKLSLNGKSKIVLNYEEKYKEPGFESTFLGKDIADKVKITNNINHKKIGSYDVKYSLKFFIWSIKEVRKVEIVDTVNPVIELKGQAVMTHQINTAFKEPGYTVSDNYDTNLEEKVVVEGNVDVNKVGEYVLTYKIKDSSGNEATVERKVKVIKKVDVNSGVTKKGVIYLTFDDGPSSETTTKILNILKEEGVKATFFVTNNGPDSLIKREFDEGHAIALHTASHDYAKIYSSSENYFADLKIVSDRVKRITGVESKIIRFPGGSSNTVSRKYNQGIMTYLTNEVLNRGYRYYDWNVDASDAWSCAKNSVSDKKTCVYKNVVNNLSKNKANIVLMHDIKYHTVDALRDIIRYGKNNGYEFEPITSDTAMVRFKVNN